MPTIVNRIEFLQKLDAVQPGLSKRGITEQSACVVFKDGRLFTYNEDIACRIRSGLPAEFEGAVVAKPLTDALNKMKSALVKLDISDDRFVVRDKRGGKTRVLLERKIKLPVDKVELPAKDKWQKLPPRFAEAVGLIQDCASKDESQTALTCVHIYPKWVEACDNLQMSRFRILTGLLKPILVKRDSIKHVITMDMTEINETKKWVHFRNPSGLILSCLRYTDKYPHDQVTDVFNGFKGSKCNLPKGVENATELAEIFSKEDPDDDQVTVTLEPGMMTVVGVGSSGDHTAPLKCNYDGPKLIFRISPRLLKEITAKHSECHVSNEHLVVESKRWKYLTALTAPGGKPGTDEPEDDGDEETQEEDE